MHVSKHNCDAGSLLKRAKGDDGLGQGGGDVLWMEELWSPQLTLREHKSLTSESSNQGAQRTEFYCDHRKQSDTVLLRRFKSFG